MHCEIKDKKANEASDKAIVLSVTEEMARPRMARSARVEAYELSEARPQKPVRHGAGEPARAHLEPYGTGTPTVKNKF